MAWNVHAFIPLWRLLAMLCSPFPLLKDVHIVAPVLEALGTGQSDMLLKFMPAAGKPATIAGSTGPVQGL